MLLNRGDGSLRTHHDYATCAPCFRNSRGITSRASLARASNTRFPATRERRLFTTDSAIQAKGLVVLKDDKKLFPPDNVGLVIRQSVLKAHPAIANLLNPVAAKITSDEITKLNKKVEIDGLKPEDVARAWLTENSLL